MRVLVFGETGQVARALRRACPPGWAMDCLGRDRADLSDPAACTRLVEHWDGDGIINAAAWTAVDRAETEEDAARVVNADAPAALARAAAARGLAFLHVSTDYVFDGSGEAPWREDDPTGPQSAYGRTKLAGEEGVLSAGGKAAVLRTSWVFSADGSNFLRTMLRLGAERDRLRVVADQIGGPTPADAIARALLTMLPALAEGRGAGRVFHFSGAPDTSWADFARAILAEAGLACAVEEILTSDYPTPARRPLNSRLDCRAIAETYGIGQPDWRTAVTTTVRALAGTAGRGDSK